MLPLLEKEDPWTFFCMARWSSIAGDTESCKNFMFEFVRVDKENYLAKATKVQMAYFKNVKIFPWFQKLVEAALKQEEESYYS
jgi:hypothetical protein